MKPQWSRLGGQLGVGLCALGFLLIFLGWNGAASVDRVPSQFPYLISGGIAGLCFVVMGVGMIVVQNQRTDRAELQRTITDLQQALENAGLADSTGMAEHFEPPEPRPTPEGAGVVVEESSVTTDDDTEGEAPVRRRREPIRAERDT